MSDDDLDTSEPPAELRLDAGAVGRLNWQPRICPAPLPCIACRSGDVLTVVFITSPRNGYQGNAGDTTSWRLGDYACYRYRLDPSPADGVIIGRRIK